MNKVCIIQVQTDEAAARQVRLHRLQALSIAVIDEQLAYRVSALSNRPFVSNADVDGHEIGTALGKLKGMIMPLRAVEERTSEQDAQLSVLEARTAAPARRPQRLPQRSALAVCSAATRTGSATW